MWIILSIFMFFLTIVIFINVTEGKCFRKVYCLVDPFTVVASVWLDGLIFRTALYTLFDTMNECDLECYANSVSCFPTDSKAVDIATWPELQNLYERLHVAEHLAMNVSRDLFVLLQRLNDICKPISNVTFLTQDGVDSALSGNAKLLDLLECPTDCIRMHQMCYDIYGNDQK